MGLSGWLQRGGAGWPHADGLRARRVLERRSGAMRGRRTDTCSTLCERKQTEEWRRAALPSRLFFRDLWVPLTVRSPFLNCQLGIHFGVN